jgi:hypothetical protein
VSRRACPPPTKVSMARMHHTLVIEISIRATSLRALVLPA